MKETIKEEASGLLLQVYIDINIEKIADDVIWRATKQDECFVVSWLTMEIIIAWTAKAVDCFDHKYQIIQNFCKGGDPKKKTKHLWGRNDREEMADRGCFLPLHFYNSIQEMVKAPPLW